MGPSQSHGPSLPMGEWAVLGVVSWTSLHLVFAFSPRVRGSVRIPCVLTVFWVVEIVRQSGLQRSGVLTGRAGSVSKRSGPEAGSWVVQGCRGAEGGGQASSEIPGA